MGGTQQLTSISERGRATETSSAVVDSAWLQLFKLEH